MQKIYLFYSMIKMEIDFRSDNTAGAHPNVIDKLQGIYKYKNAPYGHDPFSQKLHKKLCDFFECDLDFFLTLTGTAANALALSTICPSYGLVYCQNKAHIDVDECGSPEFFTHGAKLLPVSQEKSEKIDIQRIAEHQQRHLQPHNCLPTAISLTQPTEKGVIYSIEELHAIKKTAAEFNLYIHMDGARLSNALVHLDCTPADITWKSGVDVMSMGMTKNGAICAEAIIFFNKKLTKNFDYIHKKAGQLPSKMSYFSAQWLAMFENNLWHNNAIHANKTAAQLAETFVNNSLCHIVSPVNTNCIIVNMPPKLAAHLTQHSILFYPWGKDNYRFMTSWQTKKSDIDTLSKVIQLY